MPETFLMLLAAGVMLAAAICRPADVTLRWLRLAGIIALSMAGLSLFFLLRRGAVSDAPAFFQRMQVILSAIAIACVLGQLAFDQIAMIRTQRVLAAMAFVVGVLAGCAMLHDMMLIRGSARNFEPKPLGVGLQALSSAGVAAMTGLCLMDMLLGHAYLTASKMTIAPFLRLNRALAITTIVRGVIATGGVFILLALRPLEGLWVVLGLYIGTRWLVGLAVPGVFIYMAHDCIRRRSTQSATGILYVAGVLVFIGELVALYLVRETGLPF